MDYNKGTTPQAFALLRIFQSLTTDPSVFNVPIKHFEEVTEVFGLEYAWVRLTMSCAMYAADRDPKAGETKKAGGRGKVEPIVSTLQTLKTVIALDPEDLEKIETFLADGVQRYWYDMQSQLGEPLLKELGASLRKIGCRWKKLQRRRPSTPSERVSH